MELLLAGLVGVVVGAILAVTIVLYAFQRRADRDLIERRVRVCAEYLDCLGDIESVFEDPDVDPAVLEQAWVNFRAFCREFHLSGWVLSPAVQRALGAIVADIERFDRSCRSNGAGGGGRAVQTLCERYHQVVRIVEADRAAAQRDFRRFRFLSILEED
jgi:hypothetical protein